MWRILSCPIKGTLGYKLPNMGAREVIVLNTCTILCHMSWLMYFQAQFGEWWFNVVESYSKGGYDPLKLNFYSSKI